MVTQPRAWWYESTTQRHEYNYTKLTEVIQLMNSLRADVEDWKVKWRDVTLLINSVFNENVQLLTERDEALETIENLQRQLKLRTKMIDELRAFLDQETSNTTKFAKRHEETMQEILKRKKKKALITGK